METNSVRFPLFRCTFLLFGVFCLLFVRCFWNTPEHCSGLRCGIWCLGLFECSGILPNTLAFCMLFDHLFGCVIVLVYHDWYIVMHYSSIFLIKNTVASVSWNTVPCVPFGLEHRRSVFDCSMLCGTVFHPCSTVRCMCFRTQFYGIWNEWLNPVPCLEIQWTGVPTKNT